MAGAKEREHHGVLAVDIEDLSCFSSLKVFKKPEEHHIFFIFFHLPVPSRGPIHRQLLAEEDGGARPQSGNGAQ